MIPQDIASKITICDEAEAEQLRRKYLDVFVNSSGEWYKENVGKLESFSDGLCYTGYLWDCLLERPKIIGMNEVKKILASKVDVFVFWDNHSKDRIQIRDYWKFPKRAIVRLDGNLLKENFNLFPEDIYIFDDTFAWSLIMTHEWIADSPEKNIYAYCGRDQ